MLGNHGWQLPANDGVSTMTELATLTFNTKTQEGEFKGSCFADARIEVIKVVEPTFDPSFFSTVRWHAWQVLNKNAQCCYLYSEKDKDSHTACEYGS